MRQQSTSLPVQISFKRFMITRHQLNQTNASFQLLDVDQIYLTHHNGGASIINAKKIGPDAKKKMVDGKEVIKLCDDGIHKVVWEIPMAGG